MRTYTFEGKDVTVTYMDDLCFVFDPCIIIVDGTADTLNVRVTIKSGEDSKNVKAAPYNGRAVVDIRQYMRSMFAAEDLTPDGKTLRAFSVTVAVFTPSALTTTFDVSAVWGTKREGDDYEITPANPRTLHVWGAYPFTFDIYSPRDFALTHAFVSANASAGVTLSKGLNRLTPPTADGNVKLTRRNTAGRRYTLISFIVDNTTTAGVYLRWMNHLGMWCYYLFTPGDLAAKVTVSNVRRNNMVDSDGQGWDTLAAVRQQSTRMDTLALCAPSVDSETFDYLADILTAPVVERYMGVVNDEDVWRAVTPVSATITKEGTPLQDFVFSIQEEQQTISI